MHVRISGNMLAQFSRGHRALVRDAFAAWRYACIRLRMTPFIRYARYARYRRSIGASGLGPSEAVVCSC